jgi:hypothetical protein
MEFPPHLREWRMPRVFLAVGFSAISAFLILSSIFSGFGDPIREILGNLGSEVFGILVTIAFVDWVLELRRRQDGARALGWDVLHAIGNAVWVWQGGVSMRAPVRHWASSQAFAMRTPSNPALGEC